MLPTLTESGHLEMQKKQGGKMSRGGGEGRKEGETKREQALGSGEGKGLQE